MIYSIFATKDTTIFENSASMNTGIDEILEITKLISHSAQPYKNKVYNSRALLQFDIASLSQSMVDGIVGTNNFKCYLNMYISEASYVAHSYGLEARPISQSWEMGIGRLNHYPATTEGASWEYRDGAMGNKAWLSGSWASIAYPSSVLPTIKSSGSWTTASYGSTIGDTAGPGKSGEAVTIGGGGHWYITGSNDYYASQTFTNESADIRMDVTNIVKKWISGSNAPGGIENDGFILKRSGSQERDSKDRGSLKFFSRDTHTIYPPRLEICWDDHSHTGTDTLSELDMDNTCTI